MKKKEFVGFFKLPHTKFNDSFIGRRSLSNFKGGYEAVISDMVSIRKGHCLLTKILKEAVNKRLSAGLSIK